MPARDIRDIIARAQAALNTDTPLLTSSSASMRRSIALAERFQETVAAIANVTGRAGGEVEEELLAWVASLPFPAAEMIPIAKRNVMAALPMTRLPAFKKIEIETGSKYMPGGMGLTWEDVVPFEW